MPMTSEAQMPAWYSVGSAISSPPGQGSGRCQTEMTETSANAIAARMSVLPMLSVAAAITTGARNIRAKGLVMPPVR